MTTKQHATPADFTTWAARATEATNEAIAYTIRDCAESARAMRDHDPVAEGRYLDEMHTYCTERAKRQAAA